MSLISQPNGFVDPAGFNPCWWTSRVRSHGQTFLAVVNDGGTELARIEMVDKVYPGCYLGVTESPKFFKIHLLEVHPYHRRQGVATATLNLLAQRYADRQLLAFSEADEFWQSVGWSRHIHRDDDPLAPCHQVLFIQPA